MIKEEIEVHTAGGTSPYYNAEKRQKQKLFVMDISILPSLKRGLETTCIEEYSRIESAKISNLRSHIADFIIQSRKIRGSEDPLPTFLSVPLSTKVEKAEENLIGKIEKGMGDINSFMTTYKKDVGANDLNELVHALEKIIPTVRAGVEEIIHPENRHRREIVAKINKALSGIKNTLAIKKAPHGAAVLDKLIGIIKKEAEKGEDIDIEKINSAIKNIITICTIFNRVTSKKERLDTTMLGEEEYEAYLDRYKEKLFSTTSQEIIDVVNDQLEKFFQKLQDIKINDANGFLMKMQTSILSSAIRYNRLLEEEANALIKELTNLVKQATERVRIEKKKARGK